MLSRAATSVALGYQCGYAGAVPRVVMPRQAKPGQPTPPPAPAQSPAQSGDFVGGGAPLPAPNQGAKPVGYNPVQNRLNLTVAGNRQAGVPLDPAVSARGQAQSPAAQAVLRRNAQRDQQAAITANNARNGGFWGDLARLGTYAVAGGAPAQIARNYLPQDLADVLLNPTNVADEVGDQLIPGGSGASGGSLLPFLDNTKVLGRVSGADKFFPSETIQSGSLENGYRGVTNSGNTGFVSGLVDGDSGYHAFDPLADAIGGIGGGGGGNGMPSGLSAAGMAGAARPEDALPVGNARAMAERIAALNTGANAGTDALSQDIRSGAAGFERGAGSQNIAAVDQALTSYNPATASLARAQLADATQQNMAQSLALARSARGGPAAQAQAMRMAQAEGAASMSQQARDLAALRAREEDTAKQRELDALLGRGNLAQAERSAGVTERGQNVTAATQAEQIKQARDSVVSSALSEGEKQEALLAINQAQLGYELSPQQKEYFMRLADKLGDPGLLQQILGGVQAGSSLITALAMV